MTARNDLDSSLQYLTDGITAHVAALAEARRAAVAAIANAEVAAALASDETYIVELTGKLKALTELLNASVAPPAPPAPTPPDLPVTAPVLTPADAVVVSQVVAALPVEAQPPVIPMVAPDAPVTAPDTPVAVAPPVVDPSVPAAPATPAAPQTLMEMMASVAAAMTK